MSKNILGGAIALALLVGILVVLANRHHHHHHHHSAPTPAAPVIMAPVKEPVVKASPPVASPHSKVQFSEPGRRVFYIVDDAKKVHYCYEDADLPLTAADVGAALEKYGETAPDGKLATAFICL